MKILIKGKLDLFTKPSRQVHSVSNGNTVDTLPAVCNEGLATKDSCSPSVKNAVMLRIEAIGFGLELGGFDCNESFLCVFDNVGCTFLKLVNGEFVVFNNQLCLIHLDFETVGTASITGRGDENAGSAVFILYICGNIVFNLDVVPVTVSCLSKNLNGHTADPLPEVELVGALIHKNAAAFACPGCSPAT